MTRLFGVVCRARSVSISRCQPTKPLIHAGGGACGGGGVVSASAASGASASSSPRMKARMSGSPSSDGVLWLGAIEDDGAVGAREFLGAGGADASLQPGI